MWSEIIALFQAYMGTGLIVILYLLSVLYLFLHEEKKHVRITMVAVPVCLLIIYFNILFVKVVYGIVGEEIYYRILWLLPMTVGIAYTACRVYKNTKREPVFLLLIVGFLVLAGKCVYTNGYFSRAENAYHVPDSVIEVCDRIVVPGREVMAAFPDEMLPFVRQYTALVRMPYGREVLVSRWSDYNTLEELLREDVIELAEIKPYLDEYKCHFVIISEQKEILGDAQDFDLEIVDTVSGYVIYRNLSIELITDF